MPPSTFESTSSETPSRIVVSFANDPAASLGASLTNYDRGQDHELFVPSYAVIFELLEGDTIARKCGVSPGDCIVAVNDHEFRRFPPRYDEKDVTVTTQQLAGTSRISNNPMKISNKGSTQKFKKGEGYAATLGKIKQVKSGNDPENPLVLTLERYGWNSTGNAWHRYLAARDGHVGLAIQMMEENEKWRKDTFPIALNSGIQKIIKSKAISEIDLNHDSLPPTVYVNFRKLQALEEGVSSNDVVDAFVIFTEMLLARSTNPTSPKTCQFIDLSETPVSLGLRISILKQIYSVFEPNYPETLEKMIMYPVSSFVRRTSSIMLNFVNAKTRKKFIITDDLELVCKELGWDKEQVEACGGVTSFMHQHEKNSDLVLDCELPGDLESIASAVSEV